MSGQSHWYGKKCIVTGGTGFIGSHLCAALQERGAIVYNLDSEAPYEGTCFSLVNHASNITTVVIDVSGKQLGEVVSQVSPEVIFHLSASPYAPDTDRNPTLAFRNNVLSTISMLRAAEKVEAKFVLASSACVFGAARRSPLRVDDTFFPAASYYTITKRLAERATRNAASEVETTICRMVNVYGPGDRHFGRLVPQMCRQIIEGAPRLHLRRSAGHSIFEFLFVDDAVSGLMRAAEATSARGRTFHFGPGEASRMRVIDVAAAVSEVFDSSRREVIPRIDSSEAHVEKYLELTDTLTDLGWSAIRRFEDGLADTVAWYSSNIRKLKAH